jgi:hypothetical protein
LRVYFGATGVDSSTDDVGNVTFTYTTSTKYTYSISFTASYNDDGTPKPFEFSGSRSGTDPKDPTKSVTDDVSGTQVVATPANPPTVDWTQMPGWMQASTILTVFGTGIPLFFELLKACRNAIGEKLNEKTWTDLNKLAKERIKDMADAAANVAIQQLDDPANEPAQVVFHLDDIANAVDRGVVTEVQRQPDPQNLDLAAVRNAADLEWQGRLREISLEQNGAAINQAMSPFGELLDIGNQQRSMNLVVDHTIQAVDSATRSSQYFGDVMATSVARLQANDARERVVAHNNAHDIAQQELQEVQERKRQNELELQRISERKQSEDVAARQADEESEVRIHREQEEIEQQMSETSDKARTEADKAREEQRRAEQRDQEASDAQDASQEHEGEVTFHGD